ncbi:hypothetical protein RvY_16131 [Ramazzottius varieornatus]|uniref:Uncharacterized protein n=1 Tax=Ramazzottius varieornatus TaxID=947166 RepID=A0A1D1W552_RAMVA|nr:hypothetical protein RvY_16131 [Ramazzottius varieornatus]
MEVTYQISGKSGQEINLSEARTTFRENLRAAGFAGVEATDTTLTTDRTDTDDTDSPLPDGPSTFSFTDHLLMTYSTAAERDFLKQQIQLVWQNTLRDLYQATGVIMTFVRERVVINRSGATRNEVTFGVSGTSRTTVSVSEAKSAFRRSLRGTPVTGVDITETTIFTSSQTTDTSLDGAVGVPPSSSSTFSFSDRVLMTYSTAAERDVLIQQIQQVWQNTLRNLYQATGVTVTFLRERLVTSPSGTPRNEVTFRVFGTSRMDIIVAEAKSAFRRSLSGSPIAGVEIGEVNLNKNTDTDMDGQVDTRLTSKVVKTKPSNSNRPDTVDTDVTTDSDSTDDVVYPISPKSFSFTDKLVLTYATTAERDALLRQIQEVYRKALTITGDEPIDVTVTFLFEPTISTSSGLSGKVVTLNISCRSVIMIDVTQVKAVFRQVLTESPLRGVDIVGGTTVDSDMTTDAPENTPESFRVSFTDSVLMKYVTSAERQTLLRLVQDLWRNTLTSLYRATDVTVTFVSERALTTSLGLTGKEGTFQVSARSPVTVDVREAKFTFRQSLTYSPLAGIESSDSSTTVSTYSTADTDSPVYNPSAQPTPFFLIDTILMECSTPAERNIFIKQIQNLWQSTLWDLYQGSSVTSIFLNERTVTTNAGLTRQEVQYKVVGRAPVTIKVSEAKSAFRQNLLAARLVGIDALDKSMYTYTTISDFANSDKDMTDSTVTGDTSLNPVSTNTRTFVRRKGITVDDDVDDMDSTPTNVRPSTTVSSVSGTPQTIEGNLLLAYSTREERDRDIGWIRRLWACVLNTEVSNVDATIIRDILLPTGYMPSKKQAHNVTYVVTYGAAPFNFQASYYKRQFQQILAASTTSYLVTFPQGDMPDSLNLTVIDQIRRPGAPSLDLIDQDGVKSFMIYDTITFSYSSATERNRVLEIIRRAWETAFGDAATNVDLVVHQDMLNADITHQLAYVITVLTTQMDWNVQQLQTKVFQVLSNANIPLLVAADKTVQDSTQPCPDNGVRSLVFYDTVTMTYTTEAQKKNAIETLRTTWQQVLGSGVWNVQVSVYDDKAAPLSGPNAHRVSYSIMFSSMKTNWNFDTLERRLLSVLPTTQTGTGYSFITLPSLSRELEDSADSDDSVDGSFSNTSIEDRAPLTKTKTNTNTNSMSVFDDNNMNHGATKHYFLSDAVQMEYTTRPQRDEALEAIRSIWADLLGSAAYSVDVSVKDDFSLLGGRKHNIHYSILVESIRLNLDLSSYVSRFWSTLYKSDNVVLQTATRLVVRPYVQGTTNWNAEHVAPTTGKVVKKGTVTYSAPTVVRTAVRQTSYNPTASTYAKKSKTVLIKTVAKVDNITDDDTFTNQPKVAITKTVSQRTPYYQNNRYSFHTVPTPATTTDQKTAYQKMATPIITKSKTATKTSKVVVKTDNVGATVATVPAPTYHYTTPVAVPSFKVSHTNQAVPYYQRNKYSQTTALTHEKMDNSATVQKTTKKPEVVAPATSDNVAHNVDTFDLSPSTVVDNSASRKSIALTNMGANSLSSYNKNQNTRIDSVGYGQGADFVRGPGRGRGRGHGHGGRRDEVEIRGSLTIRYRGHREMRSILRDIKKIWLTSDTLSEVRDVHIAFSAEIELDRLEEDLDRDDVHTVTYTITGVTRRPFEEDDVRRALKRELWRANVDYLVRDRSVSMRAL